MNDVGQVIMAIFGGVVTLAMVSVIVSRKSVAPQAIQAATSGLANVVAAAVNPVHTAATNGYNNQAFQSPNIGGFSMHAFS